jgi:hypothetical protein
MNAFQKLIARANKLRTERMNEVRALPKMPRVMLSPNYVNPITLEFPKGSIVVYEITNRQTGRKDYFDKDTFWKLAKRAPNNYWLLTADPKKSLGFRNPTTRSNIYPRNVRRVTAAAKKKPGPNTAARKIQSAVRKHLSKKRVAPKKKTPTKSKRVSK